MSSRSKPSLRLSPLLAALFLTLTFVVRATDPDPPAPPAATPASAPGVILPDGEPGAKPNVPRTSKDTPQPAESQADTTPDQPLPGLKPLAVNYDRDYEIAHLVGGLIEQHHYLQTPISSEMSQRWLKNYLQMLDPTHLFFLQSDVDEFTARYGNNLGDLLRDDDEQKAVQPAFEIFLRYRQRLYDNISFAEKLVDNKFDFTKDETFTIRTDKSPWITDADAAQSIWRGQVKSDLLNGLLDKQSPEVTIKRVSKRYRSLLREREEMEDLDVLEAYLDSLTHAYDPHSDYFQPDEAENFKIQSIDLSVTGIGAMLRPDDGYATIEQIIPGGPADLDKRLQAGDRIIAVGQGSGETVDAVDMKLNKVVDMIRGPKGTMVHLVVLPAGAAETAVHKDIILKRDLVSIKDSQAKASIIQHPLPQGGTEKVGVITLPGFYKDSADDVAKLVQRLKREQVAGIVLDFRNNGGGLLDQAIVMTDLFVNHQTVVQVRHFDGYIDPLGSEDTTQIYSGPLEVVVNRASASATEIVAGALQDYGRAVIVGDTSTHGKGTVQTLIPLKDQAPIGFVGDPGNLKLTIQKFYRVAGGSTQQKGVVPDIVLPSMLDAFELGETTLHYFLPYDTVKPASFQYLGLTSDCLPLLRDKSAARVAASPDFAYIRHDVDYYKKKILDSTVSLNEAIRLKEQDDLKALQAARKKDLEARKSSRDQVLELTLDMVDKNSPAAPPAPPADKHASAEDSDSDGPPDLDSAASNPTDDPQLDEAVNIMCDYTNMLHNSGSKLVQAIPTTAK